MITSENYREVYEELVEETDDFTSESGVVKCTTKKASDIIREILSNYYNIIDYGISDIEEVDGNVYMVIYNDLIDTDIMESLKLLDEKIVKKGSQWQVQSEKGRNMGTYSTKKEAEERLKQVEYFKHKNESIDDDFKLHHSLKEDIPTFWEWVDDQGLDPDVVEENPDLEEYFRQQYDITYNFKTPEDYDLLDTDVPDDDFDFQQEEESLDYHFVCYYEDDDSPGEQTGNAETLEDAIKMCKGYINKYDYDNAEIFGPNGDTVATFYEGEWNTDYNADINDMDLEEIEEINPNISLCKDDYTGKYYIVDNTNQEILAGGTTSLEKAKQLVDDVKEYLSFGESLTENINKFYVKELRNPDDEQLNTVEEFDSFKEARKYVSDLEEQYADYDIVTEFVIYTNDGKELYHDTNIVESLNEGARSGIHQVSLQLNLLKELKKNPNYKEDPRWERYDGIYDNIDEVIADLNDELFDLRQDRKWESLNEENELEFSPNYNPAGTPLGKGTGLGEELDDEEPSLECLNCGCDTEWLGTQGDLEEFKCPECGEYYYLTKDGRIVGEKAFSESLTEALIDRDMDTIKKSDLLKAPVGSVLKVKFNERPNNNWIDAYLKVDGDNWAVLNDAGDIDRDYDLLNSQTLYFSFIDSFDEMTEFEIDTAPNKKYNFNLTEAVIDFYNNNIKKQYSRFCDIYERAFEKIPNLKIKVINRSYVAEKTINSSGASASIGILGGDSDGTFFELRLDPEASDSFATYYIDKDGNVSVESTIYGNIVELCHLFDKNKDRLIDLITPLFNAAYDKLSEAIKNAGFKLGESLTEAKNDTLNPAIWENNELKPEVKEKLELIVDKFKDRLKEDGVDIDIDDVIIVGSNANYNYTDKSDIDLHLVADLSIYKDKEDLAQVVYNAYRRLFNDKFDPMIYGHEVELYIEPKE